MIQYIVPVSERKSKSIEFYKQLREPERSEAIANFDEDFSVNIPTNLIEALVHGFDWGDYSVKDTIPWVDTIQKLERGIYFKEPFNIEDLAREMFPDRDIHINVVIATYNKLKELGKIKD